MVWVGGATLSAKVTWNGRFAAGMPTSGLMTMLVLALATVVVVVPLLFPGFESVAEVEAVAVFVIVVPAGVVGPLFTVSVRTALPGANDALLQESVPDAPTAGPVHDQPAGAAFETN